MVIYPGKRTLVMNLMIQLSIMMIPWNFLDATMYVTFVRFDFFTSISLILILKTSQQGDLSAIGHDRQSTLLLDGMLENESFDNPLSPTHSAHDKQPSPSYSAHDNQPCPSQSAHVKLPSPLYAAQVNPIKRWLRTSSEPTRYTRQASSSSSGQQRKKRRKSKDDINGGESKDDINDDENDDDNDSSAHIYEEILLQNNGAASEENGCFNDTNDTTDVNESSVGGMSSADGEDNISNNDGRGDKTILRSFALAVPNPQSVLTRSEKESQTVGVADSNTMTEDENSDCDQNREVEDNDNMVVGAIDKLAELKMSLKDDADFSSRTLRDDADVSTRSSSTLWTVAYDEIASLHCIVEEAHDLVAICNPEAIMTWYQDLRERVRKLSGISSPPNSPKCPDLSSRSFDTVSTQEYVYSNLNMPTSVATSVSTEDVMQESMTMPASVSTEISLQETSASTENVMQESMTMSASVSTEVTSMQETSASTENVMQESMTMPASVSTEISLQETSASTENVMQESMTMSAAVSTEVTSMQETSASTENVLQESMTMTAAVSTEVSMHETSASTVDAMQESMALPLQFIKDLHDITSSDELISIKIGLTGFMLAYYEPEGEYLEGVIDSKTLRPLGNHILKDIVFQHGQGRNLSKVNHDMFIISSLLQLYIQAYNQFHEDLPRIIDFMSSSLDSYPRPILSLKSLSTESLYTSVDPNGFCGYLAALTSLDCVDRELNPHHVSLQDLREVSIITRSFTFC